MQKHLIVSGGILSTITMVMLIVTVAQDREQRGLIASGQCEAREDAWYQPPPTSICDMENAQGHCMMWSQIQHDPYLRTYWVCHGKKAFWRRKVIE
jgi:hypothetical protein